MDWFRWHHGSVTDPKFALVARRAGASLPDVLAVWAYILETASQSEVRGQFGDVDAEALDCLFNFPATETRTADILAAMNSRGLTKDGAIFAWEKRQPKREREDNTAADRKRKQRAEVAGQDVVTPSHTMSHQKTPRGEKSKEENKDQKQKPDAPQSRGSRLPADWQPSETDIAYAVARSVDWKAEAENFRDFWHAKAGKDACKTDWALTWKTWIRRSPQAKTAPLPSPKSFGPKAALQPSEDRLQHALSFAKQKYERGDFGTGQEGLIAYQAECQRQTQKHRSMQ